MAESKFLWREGKIKKARLKYEINFKILINIKNKKTKKQRIVNQNNITMRVIIS